MNAPLLSVDRVTKRFGTYLAVNDLSLDIREGEFFALLGASGSGKTTLLRMLAGLETPSEGRILLDGRDVAPVPANRRPVNMMFQSYALFPHMTVERNVAYGLEMDRVPRSEVTDRVAEMLKVVELAHLARRKPDQLSGGQRQRVALARALVKRPRLLLLDEPLGALDSKLREAMQLELKRLQSDVGITFVMVTHDQEEALVMADRVAIMRNGCLLQCGTPREVYEHPKTAFAADFIGKMNFLQGTVTPGGLIAARTELPAQGGDVVGVGRPGLLAVRPERVRLDTGNRTAGLRGVIEAVAYRGLDLDVIVRIPLVATPVAVRISAVTAAQFVLHTGAEVSLLWGAEDARVFALENTPADS